MGHAISKRGVAIDPAKINVIIEWLVPKDIHDIRSFMGLTGYYCIFIEKKSRIAHPITTLQKKSVRFVWTQQCQEFFYRLNMY